MNKVNSFLRRVYDIVAAMLMCIVATYSFSACSDDDTPSVPPPYADSRIVMVYMVAENNLNGSATADVGEMLVGMNNDSLYAGDKLVIYLDDVNLPRIYMVDKTTKKTLLSEIEPIWEYDEDVNSSSPTQLKTFVDFVTTNYPADSYGLVMWSHASGWIPSTYIGDHSREIQSMRRSFGVDNGRNTSNINNGANIGHQMEISEMADALQGYSFDFIFFDACLMQNIEVAYELRNTTQYVIASPAEIPAPGANYKTMMKAMFRKDDYVDQMLSAYENEYRNTYGLVISAVNTSGLDDFAAYMKMIVDEHQSDLLALNASSMLNYMRWGQWRTDYPDGLDMQGVMLEILNEEEYAAWKEEADKIFTCVQNGRWYSAYKKKNEIDAAQCCGVSMFIPFDKYGSHSFKDAYWDTSWAKAVWIKE